MFLKRGTISSTETYWEQIHKLHRTLEESEPILLGQEPVSPPLRGFPMEESAFTVLLRL